MGIVQPIIYAIIALGVGFVLWGVDLPSVIGGFIKFMLKLIFGLSIIGVIIYFAITILFPNFSAF